MKPEEALQILELPKDPLKSGTHYHAIPSSKRISYADYLSARKAAIQSLEKQVGKKPIMGEFGVYVCSDCECVVEEENDYGRWEDRFCPSCGQKINWEETP